MKRHTQPRHAIIAVLIAVTYLAGCASTPTKQPAGKLQVSYSLNYPDGSRLKEVPKEVRIIQRETTQRQVGAQVALNVFMLALGGGMGVQTFGKDELKGDEIEDTSTRENLLNPVASEFVQRLQGKVDAALKAAPALQAKSFAQPLLVAGGNARLVYETLLEGEEEQFRLKNDLVIYKRKENAGMWDYPFVVVNCESVSSEPRLRSQWAQQDYLLIGTELGAALDACEAKVMAALPELLEL